MNERAWPFPILKAEAEWTAFDRAYIDLMRAACAWGYSPREGLGGCVELGRWPEGRSVSLVHRGSRNGWEPFLADSFQPVWLGPSYGLPLGESACVCIRPPFSSAAHLALEWMGGRSLESLLQEYTFVGGYPHLERLTLVNTGDQASRDGNPAVARHVRPVQPVPQQFSRRPMTMG